MCEGLREIPHQRLATVSYSSASGPTSFARPIRREYRVRFVEAALQR